MGQKVSYQIIDLFDSLAEQGVSLSMTTSKARCLMEFELVIYATNMSDDDAFWAGVPENALPLRAELHDIILKHNQSIL